MVTFAFTVPLQSTSAEDPFEISAVFLAVDDSDTRVTQSLEKQSPAGQAAFEARAASLGASGVNLLPGGSYTGDIAFRLVCAVRTAGTAAPERIEVGDLDGDGDLDIAATNRDSDDVSVLLNNGSGAFVPAANYNAGDAPLGLAVGDLDGDGDLDVATANLNSDAVSVLLNND